MTIKTKTLKNRYRIFGALCVIMLLHTSTFAAEICEARIDCPGNYNGDTLVVPDNVVMLSKAFRHCSPTYIREDVQMNTVDTISLFFLIDHSASMQVNDSGSNRYAAAATIIDSLRLNSPASEVGIAIFSNQLMHSYQVDSHAKQLFPSTGWTDSYIPLTKLNDQVNGQSAAAYLKSVIALDTDKDIGGNLGLINGYYGPSGRHDGHDNLTSMLSSYNGTTDISLAFEAASAAFKTALYPKNRQYIVFLSDGEAQFVDLERRGQINTFVSGKALPTTLTAWINQQLPIPDQINQMTRNIRENNYSETNPLSAVWKTSGSAGELLSRILKITQSGGFASIPSTPVSMTINGIKTTDFDDSLAYFPANVVFDNPTTTLDIAFTYHYDFPLDVDSLNNYKIVISSKRGVPLPSSITTNCWEQGKIAFYINGAEVTGMISGNDREVEVRFYPPELYAPESAVLTINNSSGTDQFQLPTSFNGTYFTGTFQRESGPAKSDGMILQNSDNDSITALYVNPDVPLDIVREARRVGAARDIAPLRAWYLDQNADGYPDVIKVVQGKDRFSPAEATVLEKQMYVNASNSVRPVSISSVVVTAEGFDVIISPGKNAPRNTGLYTNERLYFRAIPELSGGGSLLATSVALEDSMAPVITEARFISRSRPAGGDNLFNDTLAITFSENTGAVTNTTPFKFYDPVSLQQYTMTLASLLNNNEKHLFLVTDISGTKASAPDKPGVHDSIWINETAGIQDVNARVQTNPQNHRAVIEKGSNAYTFSALVCPTPADPKNAPIPLTAIQGFQNVSEKTGIVILITSGQQIAASDAVSASISIYDQLGLPVVKDDKCRVSTAKDRLMYIWNGTNKKGRVVGNGIYAAVVTVKVSNGTTESLKMKIGVLHE